MFIAFEGVDGSGKSTQVRLLKERANTIFPGREVVTTREPGGSPYGEEIRKLILGTDDVSRALAANASGLTMLGLFMAARVDHLNRLIIPNLNAGKIVITDRFMVSSFAYQVRAAAEPAPEHLFFEYVDSFRRIPDLTIIFDVDIDESLRRIGERSGKSTHFETRQTLERVRDAYLYWSQLKRYPSVVIRADRTPEEVHAEVLLNIRELKLSSE